MSITKAREVAILGSTGSIGTQALEVVRAHRERFKVAVLTAQSNARLLIEQALEFKPRSVVIVDQTQYEQVKQALKDTQIEVFCGANSLSEVTTNPDIDIVLIALVGFAGLQPTLAAIKAGRDIAIANKETLVVAGELVTALAKKHQVKLLPVDSEHSAIFQCLVGEDLQAVEKVYLTASGGPFRGKDIQYLSSVTKVQALKHPNWTMGAKVTIDSATLMNKGLELIEAKWLFGLEVSQLDVIVHPQSIVHSLIQFRDGSLKAQMGLPDMKLPIQYALGYPERIYNEFPRFDFNDYAKWTFEKADTNTFKNLALAFEAMQSGGNMPCVVNAANEVVVAEFLKDQIGFLQMSAVIERCMSKVSYVKEPCLDDYLQSDQLARIYAQELVNEL